MKSMGTRGDLIATHDIPLVPYRYPVNLWDYTPAGPPYRFDLHGTNIDTSLRVFESWSTLESVVERFAAKAIPLWYPAYGFVLDSNDMVLVCYDTTPEAMRCGPYGCWMGVQAGFEVLERYHDPMEVAVWETQAREAEW